ncbi:MAG: HAD family hydrolase [Desulfovibrio sp.]|nr:HAD family hydrolase [Desulfovibrio sp.]
MEKPAKSLRTICKTGLAGIIYDCDGVMINSRAANSLFYNRVLSYFHLPPMTKEQEQYTFMATGMQALKHILPPSLHEEIPEVVSTKIVYQRDIVPLLELMPGFRTFVENVHGAGLKQAMCTNRTAEGFEDVLRFFEFPRYFDPIVTVSVAPPKPSPEGARMIVRKWGEAPERLLYIGDTSHDRDAASGAHVPFVAFNAFGLDGDLTVDSYEELFRLLVPLL